MTLTGGDFMAVCDYLLCTGLSSVALGLLLTGCYALTGYAPLICLSVSCGIILFLVFLVSLVFAAAITFDLGF